MIARFFRLIPLFPLLAAEASLAAPAQNLTPNSSAEWTGGPGSTPECWSVWTQVSGAVETSMDDKIAKFGQHSLKVFNPGRGGANTTISSVPCTGNTTYTLSVFVKTQDSTRVGVTLIAKDGKGQTLTWSLGGSKPVPATTDWLRVVHTVTTPAECRSLVPHLVNNGGVTWWDACQVEVGDRATDYVDSSPPPLASAADIEAGINLAPNPGFEEDTGWQFQKSSDERAGQADKDAKQAHGGKRSIRLSSVSTLRFWESDLIPIDPKATYRLSAWLRTQELEGRSDVFLECYGLWQTPIGRAGYDGGVYAYTDFGWGERYAVIRPEQFPVNTRYARIVCQVQGTVHAKGQAWFDDVALIAQPCTQNLSLAHPTAALAPNLFRPGESVRFRVNVHTPGLAGQSLSARVTLRDYFGRELLRRDQPFACDSQADATLALDLPGMKSTGHFVLTTDVMNGDTSLGSESASLGITDFDASAWKSDANSGFGICHLKDDRMFDLARIAGMKWERGHPNPSWSQVEREQGKWDWAPFQRSLDQTRPFALNKLVILSGIPQWASRDPDEFFVFFRKQANKRYMRLPKDLADFENYVYQTVNRYKEAIRFWEIWNEADIAFWHGTDEEYIQLMQAGYRGAKRADPACLVSMTGLAYPFPQKSSRTGRMEDGRLFLEKCLRLAKDEFDLINFHSYGGVKPLERKLQEVAALQKQFGTNKPVWITETGMPTHLTGSTEEQQAQYVVQGHALSFATGVDKVFWHCFYNWGVDPNYNEHHFGLVHYDYSPKPAFMAYCAMTRILADAKAKEQVAVAPGIRGVLFERSGQPITVLWAEEEAQTLLVKLDHESYRLTDLMGNGQTCVAPLGLARLELSRNAVYLEGARVVTQIEPPVSVEAGVVLKPGETRAVQLAIRNPANAVMAGVCAIEMPEGWRVEPAGVKLALEPGKSQASPLRITAPNHLRSGRGGLTCRLQLSQKESDGLDAGSVSLAVPIDSQPAEISLDGNLAEWKAQPALELLSSAGTNCPSGRVWLAADAEALYVSAEVQDDWVGNHRRYDSPSTGDAVELFLDLRQGKSFGQAEYGPGVYQFFLIPPDPLTPTATWQMGKSQSPFSGELDLAGQRTAHGYVLEARLPWNAFGPHAPKPGQRIGLDFAIDDVDTPQATARKAQLVWAGLVRHFGDASRFGSADLASNPAPIHSKLPKQPGNLLPNPELEADLNSDGSIDHQDGWRPTLANWNDTTGSWSWNSQVAHTGKHSLSIHHVTTHRTWESASVPVSKQTNYLASAWIRTENLGEGTASIYVACYDENGKWTGTVAHSPTLTGTNDWRQVEVTVPAGKLPARTAVIRVDLSLSKAPAGSAWFDDVEFRVVNR